jgi:hypothetical protein
MAIDDDVSLSRLMGLAQFMLGQKVFENRLDLAIGDTLLEGKRAGDSAIV